MTMASMRKKLSDYIETADDKKIKAIFTLVESDLTVNESKIPNEYEPGNYSEEFKAELDKRYADYLNGEALVSEEEANYRIDATIKRKARK